MKKIITLLSLFSTILFADLKVVASIAPQGYFLKKLLKDTDSTYQILLPQNSSPATFSPKPKDLLLLKGADIYFTIGVPFERSWLERFKSANPNLLISDTTKYITKVGKDPHIWLDPNLVKLQAKAMVETLVLKDKKSAQTYRKNYEAFAKELDELDGKIRELLKDAKSREFLVFHPSYGYFARAYGLKQIAIEHEGKATTITQLAETIEYAKEHKIQNIFVAPQFSQKEASFIADKIGAKVVVIDHLSANWDKTMLQIAKSISLK